jgi:hypothetical protein
VELAKLLIFCVLSLFSSVVLQAQGITDIGKVNDEKDISVSGDAVLLKGMTNAI